MKTNNLFVVIVMIFALVSCQNGNPNMQNKDTKDYNVDCLKEEAGSECGDLATIKTLPEKYTNSEWIKIYSKYILDNIDTSVYQKFAVCYIDDDEIPELCLYGRCFADGAMILSQHKGIVRQYGSYWSPQYIERSGLIDNGYAHSGMYGDFIVKLEKGDFKVLLHTEAVWHETNEQYFVYSINERIVDTIHGEKANEGSCPAINNAIQRLYSSKGNSQLISDSPQGVYDTKALFTKGN